MEGEGAAGDPARAWPAWRSSTTWPSSRPAGLANRPTDGPAPHGLTATSDRLRSSKTRNVLAGPSARLLTTRTIQNELSVAGHRARHRSARPSRRARMPVIETIAGWEPGRNQPATAAIDVRARMGRTDPGLGEDARPLEGSHRSRRSGRRRTNGRSRRCRRRAAARIRASADRRTGRSGRPAETTAARRDRERRPTDRPRSCRAGSPAGSRAAPGGTAIAYRNVASFASRAGSGRSTRTSCVPLHGSGLPVVGAGGQPSAARSLLKGSRRRRAAPAAPASQAGPRRSPSPAGRRPSPGSRPPAARSPSAPRGGPRPGPSHRRSRARRRSHRRHPARRSG